MFKTLALLLLVALFQPLSLLAAKPVPTNQEQYLNAYLDINDAERFEKEGHFKSAYLLYSDSLLKLLPLWNDGNWEIALLDKRLKDCSDRLHELKNKIIKYGLMSSRDDDLQFLLKIKKDLGNWEKLQNDKFK